MTVVHVLSLSAIGGVQNAFIQYQRLAVIKSKFKHEICLTRKIGNDYKQSISGNYFYLKTFTGIIRFIRILISKKYIVHFYNSLGSKPIYFLLKYLPVSNIIFHERGSAWNSNSSNFKYFVKNAEISEGIITNSKATKKFLNQKFLIEKNKMSVIYNGLVPKNSVNINKRYTDKISIGYLGRFETQKGIPSILDASVILKKYNFYFAGYGPWEEYIIQKSKENSNIFLVGKIKNFYDFLSKIDILVVPSIREPFGNVIVEAGFSGKAVIASKIDGIPEIILNEKFGYLIKPNDPINLNFRPINSLMYPQNVFCPEKNKLVNPKQINSKELASAISELAENKKLRVKLGRNLKERVSKNYSLENYFNSIENYYLNRNR